MSSSPEPAPALAAPGASGPGGRAVSVELQSRTASTAGAPAPAAAGTSKARPTLANMRVFNALTKRFGLARSVSSSAAGAGGRTVSGTRTGMAAHHRDFEDHFHFSRFALMASLHLFYPFSLPVALAVLGRKACVLNEMLPTSFSAFTNTTVHPICLIVGVVITCLEANTERVVCVAAIVNAYLLWINRQILIGVRYAYWTNSTWKRYKAGELSPDQFSANLLASWVNPKPQEIQRQLVLAGLNASVDMDPAKNTFILTPQAMRLIQHDVSLITGLTGSLPATDTGLSAVHLLTAVVYQRRNTKWTRMPWGVGVLTCVLSTVTAMLSGDVTFTANPDGTWPWHLPVLSIVITYTYLLMVVISLKFLEVGLVDFKRRLRVLRIVDSLLVPAPHIKEHNIGGCIFDTPDLRTSAPMVRLNHLSNIYAWQTMRIVAKRFGSSYLARVQITYAMYFLIVLIVGILVELASLRGIPNYPMLVSVVVTSIMGIYYVGGVVLTGGRINDLFGLTSSVMSVEQHALLEAAGAKCSRDILGRKTHGGVGADAHPILTVDQGLIKYNDSHIRGKDLLLCAQATESVRHRLSIIEATQPVTFLGIAANRALFSSILAALASAGAASIRILVPLLTNFIRERGGSF